MELPQEGEGGHNARPSEGTPRGRRGLGSMGVRWTGAGQGLEARHERGVVGVLGQVRRRE